LETPVVSLIGFRDQKIAMKRHISELSTLVSSIEHINRKLETKSKELKSKEELFHSVFPDVCPLCNRKTK